MSGRCGAVGAAKPVTPEIQEVCNKIKAAVEEKLGRSLEVFEAKQFASQIVAGVNYFIKVHIGDSDHLHLRVYQNLQRELTLHSLQESKTEEDALTYF